MGAHGCILISWSPSEWNPSNIPHLLTITQLTVFLFWVLLKLPHCSSNARPGKQTEPSPYILLLWRTAKANDGGGGVRLNLHCIAAVWVIPHAALSTDGEPAASFWRRRSLEAKWKRIIVTRVELPMSSRRLGPKNREPFTLCPLHFYCHNSFLYEYLTIVSTVKNKIISLEDLDFKYIFIWSRRSDRKWERRPPKTMKQVKRVSFCFKK